MTNKTTPYTNLTPDVILDAIESIGLNCSGSLFALNSYENRVYQVGIENQEPLIAKFYRPYRWEDKAILEEHHYSLELIENEIPIVAPLLLNGNSLNHYENYRFALFPRKGGRAIELGQLDQLEWMGRFIGRLHAIGSCKPYKHRPKLTVETQGHIPYQFLIQNNFIPSYLKDNYCRTMDEVLIKLEHCFQQVGLINYIRLHGDCHIGNILWNDAGPHIVDMDDSLYGPAIQDIWMLLSGNADQLKLQLNLILQGYREFYDFNFLEVQLIEPLRTLRMIQYSAWLATRWEDPAFPRNFPWFNTPHYWQQQLNDLIEQSSLLDESYFPVLY